MLPVAVDSSRLPESNPLLLRYLNIVAPTPSTGLPLASVGRSRRMSPKTSRFSDSALQSCSPGSWNTFFPGCAGSASASLLDSLCAPHGSTNRDDTDEKWETESVNSFTPDDYVHHATQPELSHLSHPYPPHHCQSWQQSYPSPSSSGVPFTDPSSELSSPYSEIPSKSRHVSAGLMTWPNLGVQPRGYPLSPLSPCEIPYPQQPGFHSQSWGVFSASPSFAYTKSLITSPRESRAFAPPPFSPPLSPLSPMLHHLLQHGQPSAYTALSARFFPFTDVSAIAQEPLAYPVVKLANIPFGVSRNEIAVFLGHYHRLPDSCEPIHIMMCRSTGKTMEVFVELETSDDLEAVCDRYEEGQRLNRPSKIGNRAITVAESSQSELMRKMFPTVCGIEWDGARPVMKPLSKTQARACRSFHGFISEEEVTMAIRHVEYPQKSPFSRGCPERAFEFLISTLRKYPWKYPSFITIGERYNLFKLTFQLVDFLQGRTKGNLYPSRITPSLFQRVIDTALYCPGFTPFMKANLADLVGLCEEKRRKYGIPSRAIEWRHQYGLIPRPDIPPDVLEWYIGLVREYTSSLSVSWTASFTSSRPQLSSSYDNIDEQNCTCWGEFWRHFPQRISDGEFDHLDLETVAFEEFAVLKMIITHALGSA